MVAGKGSDRFALSLAGPLGEMIFVPPSPNTVNPLTSAAYEDTSRRRESHLAKRVSETHRRRPTTDRPCIQRDKVPRRPVSRSGSKGTNSTHRSWAAMGGGGSATRCQITYRLDA